MKKNLKWIVAGFGLLIVVAIVIVVMNLNRIVRVAVEKGSTQQLQIPTTLGGASVGLLSGDVSLKDYVVASPEGFSAPHMLKLGSLSVDTSYGKVFGEPVAIDSIVIDKPQLTLEFKGTKSNLKTLADKLASGTGGDQTPTDGNAKPMKLIIDNLAVNGAQVVIMSDLLGGKSYTIDVPAIQLQAIGNADGNRNGEEVGKVVSQIVSRLTIEAEKSGKLPPELAAILNGDLSALTDKIGGQFKAQAQQLQQQAMQQVDQFKDKAQAIQGQAEQKIDQVKAQAEQKSNELQDKAKSQLDKLGGGLFGGDKAKSKAADDKK